MQNHICLGHTDNDQKSIRSTIFEVLDSVKPITNRNVQSVIIKPNLCYYWHTTTGETTDPRVVSGLTDWVRDRFGDNTESADKVLINPFFFALLFGSCHV